MFMKRLLSILFILPILLAACAPGTPSPEPAATEPPAAPPLAEAPIELAGPPMEIGSRFRYVDGSMLVAVPAGEFLMGYGGFDNPEHTVFLSDFWIYRTEVTNGMYARCVQLGGCTPPDPTTNPAYGDPFEANKPVVGVNYEQAAGYCDFVHGRLPTEAEWEKTGRGLDAKIYSWGDAVPSCDLTNMANCVRKATEVNAYPQGESDYGELDSVGNVFEWVADWYKSTYYDESPSENPLGPEMGIFRSVRSSSFLTPFNQAELARRWSTTPVDKRSDLGFRCVVEDPNYFAPYCEYLTVYGLDADGDPVPGVSGSVDCPNLKIIDSPQCQNGQPITYYSFTSTMAGSLQTSAGSSCSPSGGGYACTVAGDPVEVCQDCQVTPGGPPTCPPDYHQVGDTCVIDQGYPGECLAGYTYDPDAQCCTAVPGLGDAFPLCPTGTSYAGAAGCINIPAASKQCKSTNVYLLDCTDYDRLGGYGSIPDSSPLFAALEVQQARSPVAPVSGVLTLSTLGLAGWFFYGRRRS
jgi:formylglycine-generating enzyme required for sulfatase activity